MTDADDLLRRYFLISVGIPLDIAFDLSAADVVVWAEILKAVR